MIANDSDGSISSLNVGHRFSKSPAPPPTTDLSSLFTSYFDAYCGKVYHSSSFELIPRHNPENGELLAVDLKFNGIALTFLMEKPDNPASSGIHRPGGLVFVKEDSRSTVAFKWAEHKVGHTVTPTHAGAYAGISPDHAL